jgi:hypothetical protein
MGSKSLWTTYSAKTGGPRSVDDEEAIGGLVEEKSSSDGPDQVDVSSTETPATGDGYESTKETVVDESSESVDDVPATLGRAAGSTAIRMFSQAEI